VDTRLREYDSNKTKGVFDLVKQERFYSYVISVCDKEAAERCPIFPGVREYVNWSFKDPSKFAGSYEEKLNTTRMVREQIKNQILNWIKDLID
jgi:arsenate reductase